MSKDYYKILGVTEFDSAENIKLAYRKLARKWHPDVAGNTSDAIYKFKEINEAYEILSNQIKKTEYDRARKFYNYAYNNNNSTKTGNYTSNPQSNSKSFSFNWEDFWSKKTNEQGLKKNIKAPKDGCNITTDVEINAFEAISGVTKIINMLQTNVCPKCQGKKFVNNSTCKHCNGKGEFSAYRKFTVKIPAGIKNGAKIRLAGEGSKGLNGGKNGDLYIIIHVQETKNYKTEGLNILRTIPITPFEAVLGTTVKITGLDSILNVKIAPKTQNGQKIRLANCGIVQNNKVGDMIITVEIRIPNNLTEEELTLYKKLAEISTSNIRNEI